MRKNSPVQEMIKEALARTDDPVIVNCLKHLLAAYQRRVVSQTRLREVYLKNGLTADGKERKNSSAKHGVMVFKIKEKV